MTFQSGQNRHSKFKMLKKRIFLVENAKYLQYHSYSFRYFIHIYQHVEVKGLGCITGRWEIMLNESNDGLITFSLQPSLQGEPEGQRSNLGKLLNICFTIEIRALGCIADI